VFLAITSYNAFNLVWDILLHRNPRWLGLVGIVAIGLIWIVGYLVVDARRRARIYYALTSERVMVAGRSKRGDIQSISLLTLPGLSLIEGSNGRGTVSFGFAAWPRSTGYDAVTTSRPGAGNNAPLQFNMIADARRVYQMIREAQKRVWEQHPLELPGGQPASAEAVQTDCIPDAIGADLSAGEQVLWLGRPRQGLMLRSSDAAMILALFVVALLICFPCWLLLDTVIARTGMLHVKEPGFWFFNGLIVLLVLLLYYVLIGRFFTDARKRARIHYALTGERMLIARGRGCVLSVNLRTLPHLWLTERRNGYGDIWLAGRAMPSGDVFGINTPFHLDTIPDAQRVYQMIRDAQKRVRPET
jgi:hypothetical protein